MEDLNVSFENNNKSFQKKKKKETALVDVQKFDGVSNSDWKHFQDMFYKDMLEVLKSKLEGEALSLIQDEDNFVIAWKIMSQRYDKPYESDYSNDSPPSELVAEYLTHSTFIEDRKTQDISQAPMVWVNVLKEKPKPKKKKEKKKKKKEEEEEEELPTSYVPETEDIPEFVGDYRRDWKKYQDKYLLDSQYNDKNLKIIKKENRTQNSCPEIVKIPEFSGKHPCNWKEFHDKFVQYTHSLTDVEKFDIMCIKLLEPALLRIQHLAGANTDTFSFAWNILSNIYGRLYEKERCLNNLVTIRPLGSKNLIDLKEFYSTVNKNINDLLALDVDVLYERNFRVLDDVVSKLDNDTKALWYKENNRRSPNFKKLLDFLAKFVVQLEQKKNRGNLYASNRKQMKAKRSGSNHCE